MNSPNLDTMPTVEDVQAKIDAAYQGYPAGSTSTWPMFELGRSGAAALFIPMNDDWGFKVFYYENKADHYCSADMCQAANIELNSIGLAPYAHDKIETVTAGGNTYKGFFVQRVRVFDNFDYDGLTGHANYTAVEKELRLRGIWDIKPANMGITPDDRLVVVDCSHRHE